MRKVKRSLCVVCIAFLTVVAVTSNVSAKKISYDLSRSQPRQGVVTTQRDPFNIRPDANLTGNPVGQVAINENVHIIGSTSTV